MRSFALTFAFLLIALPTRAKDIYIAAQQASTGSGSACSTAKPYTWFNNTANWGAGATQISPGTTVHLCGTFTGTPGQQLLVVRGSGTSTSPITIKFESGAVLTAPYWSAFGAISMDGRSYITIDGASTGVIRNTANGTGLTYAQNSRAIHAGSCTGCTVKNLTIANIYVRTSSADLAPTQTDLNCAYWLNSNNFTVSHVTCHDAGWAFPGYGNNFTLEYSDIYNVDHGLAFGAPGKNSGFLIHDNHIHNYTNWDSATNAYHHDGLHLWGQNGGTITNGSIYNNLFDGDAGVNITAHIYLQDSIQNVNVYNNVFFVAPNRTMVVLWFAARSTSTAYMPGGLATGNSAYNNFVGPALHTHGTALYIASQLNFTAYNNILMGGQSDITIQGGGSLSAAGINNNVYLNLNDYSDWNTFGYQGHNYQTLAQWQGVCHCDSNSKFVHYAQLNVSSQGQLLAGSVAISAAANLMHLTTGDLAALANDKVGVSRQLSGNWDAGAYKYGSTVQPASPTGVTATVQ
jgi:hypothetical protein